MNRKVLYAGILILGAGAAVKAYSNGRTRLEVARADLAKAGYQPDDTPIGIGRNGRVPALTTMLPCSNGRQVQAAYTRDGWKPLHLVEDDGTRQPLPQDISHQPLTSKAALERSLSGAH